MAVIPNLLLASLPRAAYRELLSDLSPVTLALGDVLYEPNRPMGHVYFPVGCLVSLLAKVAGHLELEIGMVGREGMVGIPLALGTAVSTVRAVVEGNGAALRMSRARFLGALRSSPSLRHGVYRYIQVRMEQVMQNAACNRFHELDGRLARRLAMTRDRVGSAEFRMTHEHLSSLLGVRREGVTEAASAFRRQDLIEYSRGNISILDHRGLEAACCSCYAGGNQGKIGRASCRERV